MLLSAGASSVSAGMPRAPRLRRGGACCVHVVDWPQCAPGRSVGRTGRGLAWARRREPRRATCVRSAGGGRLSTGVRVVRDADFFILFFATRRDARACRARARRESARTTARPGPADSDTAAPHEARAPDRRYTGSPADTCDETTQSPRSAECGDRSPVRRLRSAERHRTDF
eukprot:2262796-Prymnesium_polylepis.2